MCDYHKFDDWHDDWDDDDWSDCHRPKKKKVKCFKTSIDVIQCFDSHCIPVQTRKFPKFRKPVKKHHDFDKCCDSGKYRDSHKHRDFDHDCSFFW